MAKRFPVVRNHWPGISQLFAEMSAELAGRF
jgi:hypothetical protein